MSCYVVAPLEHSRPAENTLYGQQITSVYTVQWSSRHQGLKKHKVLRGPVNTFALANCQQHSEQLELAVLLMIQVQFIYYSKLSRLKTTSWSKGLWVNAWSSAMNW